MYVKERFELNSNAVNSLRKLTPQFGYGQFSEIIYYLSYSRRKKDGKQERWHDTVIRVINGIMSIRKDWYVKNHIQWEEWRWQIFATDMAMSMFKMEWLPPGRGLWAMGTDLIYERGAMALINCGFSTIGRNWIDDLCWIMDTLMYGVGVGFCPERIDLKLCEPSFTYNWVIPDSREGWVESVRRLLVAFVDQDAGLPEFDYSLIRPEGSPIHGFGGTASGPQPLIDAHRCIVELCYDYYNNLDGDADPVRLLTDLANIIGVVVVVGNLRRSAEIALADVDDPVFLTLKDYKKWSYRAEWGWMSNNSVKLSKPEHFERMMEIADANTRGTDVGFLNMLNIPFGRIGKDDNVPVDCAIGINPCGEQPLEDKEVCCLAESFPTRCVDTEGWLNALVFATFYASTVALLPTHQPATNAVIARNRRIGVSISDFTGWKHTYGLAHVTRGLREGYKVVRETNRRLAAEAGVPCSIRVTTVKPGGTIPKLPGRTSGACHPTFTYTLRRVRVKQGTPMFNLLVSAGYPHEPDVYSAQTEVFEFPIVQGPAKPADEVSIWEQALNVVHLQREWSDNAVSNTLYFKPRWQLVEDESSDGQTAVFRAIYGHKPDERVEIKDGRVKVYKYDPRHEEDELEAVLTHIAPLVKSVSLLPHSPKGVFAQMPEEGITKEEYERRLAAVKDIDWDKFIGDGADERFCDGASCAI